MNREKVYYRSVGILTDAYLNHTLKYGCGGGCAVANLIASNMGYTIVNLGSYKSTKWQKGDAQIKTGYWYSLTRNPSNLWKKIQSIWIMGLRQYKLEKKHIAATGYKAAELRRIEMAFESCFDIVRLALDKEQDVLKGLNAVFAVLWDIHQITAEDFTLDKKISQIGSNTAIIDRLVNRYEALSFDNKLGLQKLIETGDPYDCKQGVSV